jgi:hypothetical protein
MTMTHQCPRCELRFRGRAEIRDHMIRDHGVEPEQLDDHYLLTGRVRPHRDPPRPRESSG